MQISELRNLCLNLYIAVLTFTHPSPTPTSTCYPTNSSTILSTHLLVQSVYTQKEISRHLWSKNPHPPSTTPPTLCVYVSRPRHRECWESSTSPGISQQQPATPQRSPVIGSGDQTSELSPYKLGEQSHWLWISRQRNPGAVACSHILLEQKKWKYRYL